MILSESSEKRVPRKVDARIVLKGMYPVAFAIMLIPLFELVVGIWPLKLDNVSWRFGTIGLLLKSLVVPLFGLGIATGISAYLDSRRAVRVFAAIALLSAIVIAGCVAIFALDFLQLRPGISPELKDGVDKAAETALLIGIVMIPVAAGLGLGGWKASRLKSGPVAVRSKKDSALLVSTPPAPKESVS